jgi:hypothetical protein
VLVFNGSDLLAVAGRDKDATWRTMGTLCRELGWPRQRLFYELDNKRVPYRTIPEGYVIDDWLDPYLWPYINIEASEISIPSGVVVGAINDAVAVITGRPRPPKKRRSELEGMTIGIEVLPPTDALPAPSSPSPGTKERPTNKRVGRPPDYPAEIIQQVACDYIEVYGLPQTQTMLREKVRDECERNGYDVPEPTRFKELIAPIFKSPPDFSSDEIGR